MNVVNEQLHQKSYAKIATFHDTTVDYLLNRTDDKTNYAKKKDK